MIRISDILEKVHQYNPDVGSNNIERAYIYSARVHDGQVRLSGEPYLSHPLEVAGILADMKLDTVSITAALLHDVIEDTHTTKKNIEDMFGKETAHIVEGVTKLSALPFNSDQERQAESIRKMILAMADDIRVILIKLADRIHFHCYNFIIYLVLEFRKLSHDVMSKCLFATTSIRYHGRQSRLFDYTLYLCNRSRQFKVKHFRYIEYYSASATFYFFYTIESINNGLLKSFSCFSCYQRIYSGRFLRNCRKSINEFNMRISFS